MTIPICPKCTMRLCMEQVHDSWGPDHCVECGPCLHTSAVEELCETRELIRYLLHVIEFRDIPRPYERESRRFGHTWCYIYNGSVFDSVRAALLSELPYRQAELLKTIIQKD